MQEKNVCLLHGVTSSGKTEIYIKLIQEVMTQGKQALFLLPEIALSTQMINRLRKYFGDKVGVYHSRYNEAEKVEIWQQTGRRYQVILGARSALFLPYTNLGLVVVDEEHETSYKQQDPAPRYQARDAAIYLAHLHGAKTVLGSATPSLESYYNAIHGKYALATLFTRYNDVCLPQVWVADMREERKRKTIQGNNFSSLLVEKMNAALQAGKQIILFQNRRGFSHRLECADCGYVPTCPRCDVTLTYHKYQNILMCHYCGHTQTAPHVCPQCGGAQMRLKGFGTERIEEDLNLLFPDAKVARMDLDSTRAKDSYCRIIEDFEHRKTDILVGTQMVTKGLDFDNVGVVGIVDADGLISFPDFRAYERSFHLMTQVSGRAGRKGGGGEVVIQTHKPEYSVIQEVMNSDYASMYTTQLQERLTFQYPPFYRLVRLSVRHKDERLVGQASAALAEKLRMKLGERVLGPQFPMVSRINLYYIREILIKIERSTKSEAMKNSGWDVLADFYADEA
ncbi:MAG: primosomal protein N', partial [Bacteroidales bacterium]|nr:primosomal protein N' [Bacteroidales bacterium]